MLEKKLTNKDIIIQQKTGFVSAPLCIYNTPRESNSKVACLLYHNSKGTCCTPSMQLDRISLALTVGRWQQLN